MSNTVERCIKRVAGGRLYELRVQADGGLIKRRFPATEAGLAAARRVRDRHLAATSISEVEKVINNRGTPEQRARFSSVHTAAARRFRPRYGRHGVLPEAT